MKKIIPVLFINLITCLVCVFLLNAFLQAQTVYKISSNESTVIYYASHPMHDWSGESHQAGGTVDVAAGDSSAKVNVHIPVMSFDSKNDNRDSHMAEVLESYIYPDVTFASKQAKLLSTVSEGSGKRQTWLVEGTLTFHGENKPIKTNAIALIDNGRLTAKGEFELKLTDFNIELPSLVMISMKDWLKITFDIVAVK